MRERLYVDSTDWRPINEDLSMLPGIQDAVARNCRLSFDYTRADGERGPRVVDPLGLVVKGMTWYLVARTPRGMRTYRMSRMRAVTLLAATFERPTGFDLAKQWKKSISEFEAQWQHYETTLILSPDAAESLTRWCAITPVVRRLPKGTPKGWKAVQVEFENEDQALFVVLGMGIRARVLEPPALLDRVAGQAMIMAEVAQKARNAIADARDDETSLVE
jgi:predicted DNA-binding transcriptional regulator YafY